MLDGFSPFERCAFGFSKREAPAHAEYEGKKGDEDGKIGKLFIDRKGRWAQNRQTEKTLHASEDD